MKVVNYTTTSLPTATFSFPNETRQRLFIFG